MRQKSVDIILDRAACEAYDIAPSRVRTLLASNMNLRQYGGTIREQGQRFFVYLNAEYDHISQIEDLVIGRGNNPVRLKDIAEIFYGEKEEETISRVNGMDAVSLEIINDAQANIIELSHKIEDQLRKLNQEGRAFDIEVHVQENSAELMEDNINQIIRLALTGALLAIFVLWIFLRNVKLVLLVALAMPVSIFTAFNFFFGFDVSINSLTLIGIALAVGMLLDTSVVVLENIYRHYHGGDPPVAAAVRGTKEVWGAVIASTLTTIAVFVPVVFVQEEAGQLFLDIALAICFAVGLSLLVSVTVIPTASAWLFRHRDELLAAAGIACLPDGTSMVDEVPVARLHQALRRRWPGEAADIAARAGRGTGDYILANRIPGAAKRILKVLPAGLRARVLAKAIAKHAWTFAGSGRFRVVSADPPEDVAAHRRSFTGQYLKPLVASKANRKRA